MAREIDVIVPVYNGVKYIDNIIKSFEKQTYRDFRVIFIDDGSTDGSSQKLDDIVDTCSFDVEVIHQENSGPSSARNAGIRLADAKWIVFVDCDDEILPEYLQYMERAMAESGVDVGFCQYFTLKTSDSIPSKVDNALEADVKSACEIMRMHYTTHWIGPWSLIIRRSWLTKNGLEYDEECKLFEDNVFITTVIAYCENICVINNKLYLYFVRKNSSMNGCKAEKLYIAYDGLLRLSKDLETVNTKAVEEYFLIGECRFTISLLRRAARQLSVKEFKEYIQIVRYDKVREQEKNMAIKHRIAGKLYSFSPIIFYYAMRISAL